MSAPADPPGRRAIAAALAVAVALVVAYWTLWFLARGAVASRHTSAYYQFENAFPLADGWLVACLLAALVTLLRRRPAAFFWLVAAGASGVYLFCLDALYDVERGIWWSSGAGGWIELAINVLTLVLSTVALGWAWRFRAALGARPGAPAPTAGSGARQAPSSP